MGERTDGWTDRQADRQTDKQTDRVLKCISFSGNELLSQIILVTAALSFVHSRQHSWPRCSCEFLLKL